MKNYSIIFYLRYMRILFYSYMYIPNCLYETSGQKVFDYDRLAHLSASVSSKWEMAVDNSRLWIKEFGLFFCLCLYIKEIEGNLLHFLAY